MTATSTRLVQTARYTSRKLASGAEGSSALDKALRSTYLPYLYGATESMPPMVKALAYSIPPHKLAEQAVAQMFGLILPSGNTAGHDVDATGIELDGVDYGLIEVRTRTMRVHPSRQVYLSASSDWETVYEYQRLRADFLTSADMRRKRANPADWFFCAMLDPETSELVWFRFPAEEVFRKSSLTVTKSVDGGYGWANPFRWVGPENEL